MRRRRPLALGAVTGTAVLLLAACGGGGGGGSSTASSTTALDGVGPITLVQGKDTSNFVQTVLDGWNKDHADQKVTLIELPEDADRSVSR